MYWQVLSSQNKTRQTHLTDKTWKRDWETHLQSNKPIDEVKNPRAIEEGNACLMHIHN